MSARLVVDKGRQLSRNRSTDFGPRTTLQNLPLPFRSEVSTWDRFFSDRNHQGRFVFRRSKPTRSGSGLRRFMQLSARIREEIMSQLGISKSWVT
jgi:hypothetical protein